MWYLPHLQDNLVINNLVNKCFQQRKVLLIAFYVISNPSSMYKTKNYSFLEPMVTILSRSPVFHKIQKKTKTKTKTKIKKTQQLAYLIKLSQLFSVVIFP